MRWRLLSTSLLLCLLHKTCLLSPLLLNMLLTASACLCSPPTSTIPSSLSVRHGCKGLRARGAAAVPTCAGSGTALPRNACALYNCNAPPPRRCGRVGCGRDWQRHATLEKKVEGSALRLLHFAEDLRADGPFVSLSGRFAVFSIFFCNAAAAAFGGWLTRACASLLYFVGAFSICRNVRTVLLPFFMQRRCGTRRGLLAPRCGAGWRRWGVQGTTTSISVSLRAGRDFTMWRRRQGSAASGMFWWRLDTDNAFRATLLPSPCLRVSGGRRHGRGRRALYASCGCASAAACYAACLALPGGYAALPRRGGETAARS